MHQPFSWSCSQPRSLAWVSATMLHSLQEKTLCFSSSLRPAVQSLRFCSGGMWARAHRHTHVHTGVCCALPLPTPPSSALSTQPTLRPSTAPGPRARQPGKASQPFSCSSLHGMHGSLQANKTAVFYSHWQIGYKSVGKLRNITYQQYVERSSKNIF